MLAQVALRTRFFDSISLGSRTFPMAAPSFQVKLSGEWQNYSAEEDKILKRAFLSGSKNARFSLRGQQYETSFESMKQKNTGTGKLRDIRPPHKWKAPAAPLIEKPGPTFCISVPPGAAGTTIQVPNPKDKKLSLPSTCQLQPKLDRQCWCQFQKVLLQNYQHLRSRANMCPSLPLIKRSKESGALVRRLLQLGVELWSWVG